ncbi:MAG: serine/threonine protein kinase [Paludibacteraceae bacterium]|nr:serine/threonine protein kinase [Paludibacteraceae bacterium]
MNRFHEHYELIRVIGRGGLSEVWLARDLYTQMEVVVKIFSGCSHITADDTARLASEIRNVYQLQHSSLLKAHHFDVCEGVPYIVMPYCHRGSCRSLAVPVAEDRLWRLVHDVAGGLEYLHAHGVVHCDIKPDNLLVGDDDGFLITDFGFSAQLDYLQNSGFVSASAVSDGGTMAYMPPERFSAKREVVPASDIWALGATLAELMTGKQAFAGTSFSGGLLQKNGAELPALPSTYSAALTKCVASMLAVDPSMRPTATELLRLSEAHLENHSRPKWWRRWLPWLLGAAVLVLSGVAFFALREPSGGVVTEDYVWEGDNVGGQPEGYGVMRYHKRCLIDVRDEEMRYAEPGDYVEGQWHDGRLGQGVWYGADGRSKGLIILEEE